MANNGDENMNTDITNFLIFPKCSSNKNGNRVQRQGCSQALSAGSGHSPGGHRAPPCLRSWAMERAMSILPLWAHRALPSPVGLWSDTQSSVFRGAGLQLQFFSDNTCSSSLESWDRVGLEKTFRTKIVQDYQVHKASSAKSSSFQSQAQPVHARAAQQQHKVQWNSS